VGAYALNLQQLQEIVLTVFNNSGALFMKPFKLWSAACGSSDVTTLLWQPAALLQALQQQHASNTAAFYLWGVCQVLQLPPVAALLAPSELATLLQQLQARQASYIVDITPAAAAAQVPQTQVQLCSRAASDINAAASAALVTAAATGGASPAAAAAACTELDLTGDGAAAAGTAPPHGLLHNCKQRNLAASGLGSASGGKPITPFKHLQQQQQHQQRQQSS
jgi:hypothetical protein